MQDVKTPKVALENCHEELQAPFMSVRIQKVLRTTTVTPCRHGAQCCSYVCHQQLVLLATITAPTPSLVCMCCMLRATSKLLWEPATIL